MIPADCYSEFKFESVIIKNFISMFKQVEPRVRDGFDTHPIDKKYWSKEPLLKIIDDQFTILKCGILVMHPFTNYDWHTDVSRGVCINWLIEDTNSYCLFGDQQNDYISNIIRVPYESKRFFLFNNQIPHTVTNFENTRYVFTCVFERQKDDLSYKEVYNWCKDKDLFV